MCTLKEFRSNFQKQDKSNLFLPIGDIEDASSIHCNISWFAKMLRITSRHIRFTKGQQWLFAFHQIKLENLKQNIKI